MENILSEYDKSPGIISPDFEKMDLHLPKRAVFAFLGEKRIERFVLRRQSCFWNGSMRMVWKRW